MNSYIRFHVHVRVQDLLLLPIRVPCPVRSGTSFLITNHKAKEGVLMSFASVRSFRLRHSRSTTPLISSSEPAGPSRHQYQCLERRERSAARQEKKEKTFVWRTLARTRLWVRRRRKLLDPSARFLACGLAPSRLMGSRLREAELLSCRLPFVRG